MHALLHSVPPNLQQVTSDPCLCQRLLDTHGQVWVSLFSQCSFLLGPSAHKVLFVPSKSLFPWCCLGYGSSMVGWQPPPRELMPYPGLLHPEPLPLQQVTAEPYLHKRHSNTVLATSVGSLGPSAHRVCLSPLSVSGWYGIGFQM